MMRWIVLLLCSLSSVAFAKNNLNKIIEKYDLQPLVDSSFWKEHPGILPYEECKLFKGTDGERTKEKSISLGFGGKKHGVDLSLFCYTKRHSLAFQVPLQIARDLSLGLNFDLSVNAFKGALLNLHNKKLSDLFGYYEGANVFGKILVGVDLGLLKNEQHVLLFSNAMKGMGLSGGFAGRVLKIDDRPLTYEEVYSQYYLKRKADLDEALSVPPYIMSNKKVWEKIRRGVELENEELNALPDSRKFKKTWRFWIHHLKEHRPPSQKFLDLGGVESDEEYKLANLFGDLEWKFLETLTFKKVKKKRRFRS